MSETAEQDHESYVRKLEQDVATLTGERDRQYEFNLGQIVKQAELESEVERLREENKQLRDHSNNYLGRQINSYQALVSKIQDIVHEFHEVREPGERWSDYDVLNQGVALIAQAAEAAESQLAILQAEKSLISDYGYVLNVARTWKEAQEREASLAAQGEVLRESLRLHEWDAPLAGHSSNARCAACGGIRSMGHLPNCWYAALLSTPPSSALALVRAEAGAKALQTACDDLEKSFPPPGILRWLRNRAATLKAQASAAPPCEHDFVAGDCQKCGTVIPPPSTTEKGKPSEISCD